MHNKVSFICTTYRRFTCVKRIIYQYHAQTYTNKELIIFNTDTDNPILLDFQDESIKIINNNTDYKTNLPYTNRGQICRDAIEHASGFYFMLADDDDIYLPWHIEQAVDGIEQNGKDSWKPAQSFFVYGSNPIELVRNTLEASVIVKMQRIREIGFNTEKTGCEGLSWYEKLKDEKQLDENNYNFVPSYCFNWGDPPHISGHKQSGNINDPNNFDTHKQQSNDIATHAIKKEDFSSAYEIYYDYLKNNPKNINQKYYEKYAKVHVEKPKQQNINIDYTEKDSTMNKQFNIDEFYSYKPKSIHDIIPSEFFTKYDNWDYVWSGNCFEWYYALSKMLQPRSFMEIGVRFGFSFLPTLLGSSRIEYALGWDLETYGNNTIARENLSNYYKGDCKWELHHVDSQQMSELPRFFDLVSIDGCHDYECKIHDLNIVSKNSLYTIIDDYDYHPHVRDAVNHWMRDNIAKIEWSLYIPSFRGSQLIKFKQ